MLGVSNSFEICAFILFVERLRIKYEINYLVNWLQNKQFDQQIAVYNNGDCESNGSNDNGYPKILPCEFHNHKSERVLVDCLTLKRVFYNAYDYIGMVGNANVVYVFFMIEAVIIFVL